MAKAKKFIIACDLQLTSPMHIGALEKGTYDIEARRLNRYDAPNGIGCSLTRTVTLVQKGGETTTIPVIPASTFGGKLRRAAAELIFEKLIDNGLQISKDAYLTMTSGSPVATINAKMSTPECARTARRDPFLGVFGGTSFMLSAGSVISEGWPLLNSTATLLMSEAIDPSSVLEYTKVDQMTDAMPIVRKNDIADFKGASLEAVVGFQNICEYLETEQVARESSKSKKADKDDSKKTDLRAFNAVEGVRAGITFGLRVEVTARTPAHLGLMLLAVQRMLQDGQVGGKGARGMGRFVCPENASRLYELDPSSRQKEVLTPIFHSKTTGYEFVDNNLLTDAVVPAQDYIDNFSPSLIEAYGSANAKVVKTLSQAA